MDNEKLRALLKSKYNTPIDGEDCITFHHIQLVINTVREETESDALSLLKEFVPDSRLQTFADREKFREAASGLLGWHG